MSDLICQKNTVWKADVFILRIRDHFEGDNKQYREKNVTNREIWRVLSRLRDSQQHQCNLTKSMLSSFLGLMQKVRPKKIYPVKSHCSSFWL